MSDVNKPIPVTLGIGGPEIGKGHVYLDDSGNIVFEGEITAVAALNVGGLTDYSVSAPQLDPHPYRTADGRKPWGYVGAATERVVFDPRPEYSQDPNDYKEEA